ncbi:MAG TPA: flagellar hook-associated protein FlgL [Acetomicrobium flavidum]|uniref:flagellar hook-associated protein FlgL n=2 Tax=Acetomicrobium flavidum TaxID=49896 RepID=UPI002C923844|nr:flagellar hook-associated protein FlgL [Acetomicrobium flavidum]
MSRVTNSMMNQVFLADMHNNLTRMLQMQRQMSTGKLHQHPSDDPLAVGRELSLSTTIFENEQYQKNLDDGIMWLSNTDAALNQITDVMQRIRELTVYAGNGTFSETEYAAVAEEISQLQEELMNTADFSVEGRYLFSGLNASQKPFVRDSSGKIVYAGNELHVEYEMERGVKSQVSFHGREVFPVGYRQYTLESYEVPLSFSWTGRSEILQITVGDRTAKVTIPEKWADDNKNGLQDVSDMNGFRDPGELTGYSLDELASLINENLAMGDVGKLVSVSVEKDTNRGVQRLVIKSHTGEPLSVTSWPATDFEPLPSDEKVSKPLDHSHIGLASYLGIETSLKSVEFPTGQAIDPTNSPIYWRLESGDNFAEVRIDGGPVLSLQDLADKLNSAAGDWLQVVVQGDGEESSGYDYEAPTQKLVFRTLDGSALNIYDLNPTASSTAADLGLQTALVMDDANAVFPLDGLDLNMPALINVEVGGQSYSVKLYRDRIGTLSGGTWNVDALKVAEAVQSQVGEDLIGYRKLEDGRVALYSKTGQALKVTDLPFGDPQFSDYTSGIAANLRVHSGITGDEINGTTAPSDGVIRIRSGGSTVDVAVSAGETAEDIAKKIKGLAGSWLDVSLSLYDENLSGPSGSQRISLAAKDGSPLAVYDVQGDVAQNFLKIDTALRNESDVSEWSGSGTLSITVNGYTHTIDTAGMNDINDLIDTINARFQSGDVRAEVVENDKNDTEDLRLVLWSPKGYVIQAQGDVPELPPSSPIRGGMGPYNQVVASRTSADISYTDFFGLLDDLVQAVRQGDAEGISKSILPKIDEAMDGVFRIRTQTGALMKRYETSSSRLKQMNLNYNELYSKVSDTDLAEAATKFAMAQSVYQASLATIARIIQPTLVDFLQ